MLIKTIYFILVIISAARSASYGIYCIKNKEKGAWFLFLLSVLLLIIPITNIMININF